MLFALFIQLKWKEKSKNAFRIRENIECVLSKQNFLEANQKYFEHSNLNRFAPNITKMPSENSVCFCSISIDFPNNSKFGSNIHAACAQNRRFNCFFFFIKMKWKFCLKSNILKEATNRKDFWEEKQCVKHQTWLISSWARWHTQTHTHTHAPSHTHGTNLKKSVEISIFRVFRKLSMISICHRA